MVYGLAVIGAGASGLMAAGRAGELGVKTILIEKNKQVGIKVLMTGGTRCNLTNYLENPKILASHYGSAGRFLISAFSRFGPDDTIDFFAGRGVETKIEANNRVFPIDDNARSVVKCLSDYASAQGTIVKLGVAVKDIEMSGGRISGLVLDDGSRIEAAQYLIATGGRSYPGSGSSGDAYAWLEKMGHHIAPLAPALTPIIIHGPAVSLEGVSRPEVEIFLENGGKRIASSRGGLLFTASGLSGPAVLNISRFVPWPITSGLKLSIDFFPDMESAELDEDLNKLLADSSRSVKNILSGFLPVSLITVIGERGGFDLIKKGRSINRNERAMLVAAFKDFSLAVKGLEGYDRAMITRGGVSLTEVDPKTMRSKIVPNLLLAGEVLDIAGPTGGFNLQACWSTGRIAGETAAASV